MGTVPEYLKSPTFYLKVLELVMSAVATGLFTAETSSVGTKPKWAVVFGTLIGFIMISIIVIISTIMNSPLHRNMILMITAAGALMFITTGALIFEMWDHQAYVTGYLIGSGFVAFLNGFVYIADCILTFFKYRNQ